MRVRIGLDILVILLMTAVMLPAYTFPPYSKPSRFSHRLPVAE